MTDVTSGQETLAFDLVGDEARMHELVDRSYDLMDLEPEFVVLCALHPQSLDGSRDKLFWFLYGWLDDPNCFIEHSGHPRLRARHVPFEIGTQERDQQMCCMALVIQGIGLNETLQMRLTQVSWQTADWIRNV